MKQILLLTLFILQFPNTKAQSPEVKIYVDGIEFSEGQTFSNSSKIEVRISNENPNKLFIIDKVSVKIKVESGRNRKYTYNGIPYLAASQDETTTGGSRTWIEEETPHFAQSPTWCLDMSLITNQLDCISRAIVKLKKVREKNLQIGYIRKVTSSEIDYSNETSIWYNDTCIQ
ncbi:MAG: hypothetical protein AAGA64_17235 [Bacteroidota bacterium]